MNKILIILVVFFFFSCAPDSNWEKIEVTATAYNSTKGQTNSNPFVAAWGDTLSPGMKIIAVSRDLLKCGLKYDTRVKIEGFEGIYLVKDKMNKRWINKIDIYFGNDKLAAQEWGRRKVELQFEVEEID